MRNSACRWRIVKKAKIFSSYVTNFWIFPGVRNFRILIDTCKWIFMNGLSTRIIFQIFFFLLFRLFKQKLRCLANCYSFNRYNLSVKCFVYIALAKNCWEIKLSEFKSDQKILCQINQEILKTSKNNHNSSKAF